MWALTISMITNPLPPHHTSEKTTTARPDPRAARSVVPSQLSLGRSTQASSAHPCHGCRCPVRTCLDAPLPVRTPSGQLPWPRPSAQPATQPRRFCRLSLVGTMAATAPYGHCLVAPPPIRAMAANAPYNPCSVVPQPVRAPYRAARPTPAQAPVTRG